MPHAEPPATSATSATTAGASDARTSQDEPAPATRPETEWERKRRLAQVFGDVLPETTADEREPDADREARARGSEAWLKAQVPPHHG